VFNLQLLKSFKNRCAQIAFDILQFAKWSFSAAVADEESYKCNDRTVSSFGKASCAPLSVISMYKYCS